VRRIKESGEVGLAPEADLVVPGSSTAEGCDLLSETPRKQGKLWELVRILDLRKAGFFGKRWLVSRKRTKNLFDFAATLRKFVLNLDLQQLPVTDQDMDSWEH
jgi:hypothetical protein